MTRYEITGCITDSYTLADIQGALRKAGAHGIRKRNAFGWSNQPQVATFGAADDKEACAVCDAALTHLTGVRGALSMHPFPYA